MNFTDVLNTNITDPMQRLAIAQVEQHSEMLDELVDIRRRRMTQDEMAKRMGITQGAVARIEAGDRDPRLSTLGRYAHALGVLIKYKVDRREDGRPLRVSCRETLVPYDYEAPPRSVTYQPAAHTREVSPAQ